MSLSPKLSILRVVQFYSIYSVITEGSAANISAPDTTAHTLLGSSGVPVLKGKDCFDLSIWPLFCARWVGIL